MNQRIELFFGLGSQEDEWLFWGEDYYHLAVDWVEVFIVEDGWTWKTEEKPVEEIASICVLGSIDASDKEKSILLLFFEDSL